MSPESFEKIVQTHEKRIHYFIHHLGIRDDEGDFYQEGLIALWNACTTYVAGRSDFSTYVNWKIKNALIDQIRQRQRHAEKEEHYHRMTGRPETEYVPREMFDEELWKGIRGMLTENEWKWVTQFIIEDKAVAQIAVKENVSRDAVKNWGRHARRKLKHFPLLMDEK